MQHEATAWYILLYVASVSAVKIYAASVLASLLKHMYAYIEN